MKFVTWNCCGHFDRKFPAVVDLEPELAVLCEVSERPDAIPESHWLSELGAYSKGVAIASFTTPLQPVHRDDGGSLSVAAETAEGVGVLGIWSVPSQGARYIDELTKTIDAYEDWLTNRPCIIAGDFNVQMRRGQDERGNRFHSLVRRLYDLGYCSSHHWGASPDSFDSNAADTYFHQWNRDKPWHLDYIFAHRDLGPVTPREVGGYDHWVRDADGTAILSDHIPVAVDITGGAAG